MSRYEARWKNAQRIWQRFIELQRNGHQLYDQDGNHVTGRFLMSDRDLEIVDGHCSTVYFINDVAFDNGMHDSIAAWSRKFSGWTYTTGSRKKVFPW